jgi:sulfhydrogenase subunit beta (sulfur reductase)
VAQGEAGPADGGVALIDRAGLAATLRALAEAGYRLIGPGLRDGAIVYADIAGIADLPEGWTDRQDGGAYRLEPRDDAALFGYAATPQAWERFLHPPTATLWRATRQGDGFAVREAAQPAEKIAFIGARACDLQAIAVQDRVLLGGQYPDAGYAVRRRNIFVVAINCGTAGGTCFYASMQAGPKAGWL